MTESEWLACSDPQKMLDYLRSELRVKANERKLRLFAVACCQVIGIWMPDKRSRRGIDTAEKYADGLVGEIELKVATHEAAVANEILIGKQTYLSESARAALYTLLDQEFTWVAEVVTSAIRFSISDAIDGYRFSLEADSEAVKIATSRENLRQINLLRDCFGNPFRPIVIELTWLGWNGGTIPKLAQGVYEERAWDRLPILADALEEAGCTNADILNHCRQPGEHVRGCWVIDLILGKK
jgi:hypothetical protein